MSRQPFTRGIIRHLGVEVLASMTCGTDLRTPYFYLLSNHEVLAELVERAQKHGRVTISLHPIRNKTSFPGVCNVSACAYPPPPMPTVRAPINHNLSHKLWELNHLAIIHIQFLSLPR